MKKVCSNSESLVFPPDMKNLKTEIFPSDSSVYFLLLLLWYVWFAPKREFRKLSRIYTSAALSLSLSLSLSSYSYISIGF
jgi:hypothetical protein